ncbi:hypothetical protein BDN72DRAFT_900677 [Pluteus cervinus]|uniref:Uncharacterized protein n=1 Tax=Pluteus cervinus TaxID=181527 RepID=A0ACD3AJR1_9AGAR|nr:hypothetical protein BDN72DRAFT_900677 [Pluteus cervinus]
MSFALANTEIINFSVQPSNMKITHFTNESIVLAHDQARVQHTISTIAPDSPCINASDDEGCLKDLWIILNFDHDNWREYGKFTLRLSYAASTPADISLTVTDVPRPAWLLEAAEVEDNEPTYQMYARIRAVNNSIFTPGVTIPAEALTGEIPFILVLEPLYFGFLPASINGCIQFLFPIVFCVSLAIPRIIAFFRDAVADARKDRETPPPAPTPPPSKSRFKRE